MDRVTIEETAEAMTKRLEQESEPRLDVQAIRIPPGAKLLGYVTMIGWEDGRKDASWYRTRAGREAGLTMESLAAHLAKAKPAREPKSS